MRKAIFFYILLFMFSWSSVRAAECEIVMDADSGRVLYGKNIKEERLIASTTKILTAYVVLNNSSLQKELTAGEEVLDAYGSSIYLKVGEKMTVEDLLYGLMLRSGNDAALVLAKNIGGSVQGFVKLMNETAESIGMKNTVFNNPHGLDDDTQNKSTVYDMALLMKEAMKNEQFREITKTTLYKVKTNFGSYEWYNKNKLLTNYKYATGGKIGYTTLARHTFVSSATKDGKNLIVATFVDGDRFVTHENLYEKYFDLYKKYTLIDKDSLNIKYKNGYKVYTTESFSMLLAKNELDKVQREVVLYDDVKVDTKGSIIGYMTIKMDGVVYKRLSIFADKPTVKKNSFLDWVKGLFSW